MMTSSEIIPIFLTILKDQLKVFVNKLFYWHVDKTGIDTVSNIKEVVRLPTLDYLYLTIGNKY